MEIDKIFSKLKKAKKAQKVTKKKAGDKKTAKKDLNSKVKGK